MTPYVMQRRSAVETPACFPARFDDDILNLEVLVPSEHAVKQQVQAIFENGVLRPLEQIALSEHEQVSITIDSGDDEWLDAEMHALAQTEGKTAPSLAVVRERLARIKGSLAEAVIAERGEY